MKSPACTTTDAGAPCGNDAALPSGPGGELYSVLTCPYCGHAQREVMPTDACLFFYECPQCKKMLRPAPGDCCVFCSYGSVKCPSARGPCC